MSIESTDLNDTSKIEELELVYSHAGFISKGYIRYLLLAGIGI